LANPYFFLDFRGFFDAAACVEQLLRQSIKEIIREKARSAKILRILGLKCIRKPLNCKKMPKNFLFSQIFWSGKSLFLPGFSKCLFIPPPRGGGFRPEYLPLVHVDQD